MEGSTFASALGLNVSIITSNLMLMLKSYAQL
jgi:hypothetical protein